MEVGGSGKVQGRCEKWTSSDLRSKYSECFLKKKSFIFVKEPSSGGKTQKHISCSKGRCSVGRAAESCSDVC